MFAAIRATLERVRVHMDVFTNEADLHASGIVATAWEHVLAGGKVRSHLSHQTTAPFQARPLGGVVQLSTHPEPFLPADPIDSVRVSSVPAWDPPNRSCTDRAGRAPRARCCDIVWTQDRMLAAPPYQPQ